MVGQPPGPVLYSAAWVVVVICALVIARSASVAITYARVLHRLSSRDRRRRIGVRAWHISTIASVLAGLFLMIGFGMLETIGFPSVPREARYIIYAVLGVLALVSLQLISGVVADRAKSIDATAAKPDDPSAGRPSDAPRSEP